MNYIFATSWPHGPQPGGFCQYEFDASKKEVKLLGRFCEKFAIGTIYVNKEKSVVYALQEDKNPAGSQIFSYKLAADGSLTLIGTAMTYCPNAAYLGISKCGKYAVVANHSVDTAALKIEKTPDGKFVPVSVVNDAVVELFEIKEDGALGELLDVVKHTETSVAVRQNMSHPHCAVFSPVGDYCAVCDKGSDIVRMYKIDVEKNQLKEAVRWKKAPGFKPRYAAFHPTKPFFYHNNEGNGLLSAYKYDTETDRFDLIADYASEFAEGSQYKFFEQQGLCMHPSGKYVYNALHGPQAVCVFEINQESGELTQIQSLCRDFDWLRGMAISPDGKYLAATYMNSEKVAVYEIGEDGKLTDTGLLFEQSNVAGITFFYN